jgi:DNA-binding transcriptional MerR regulator
MFSIGEFARLGGVSVRTLRHYDEIGLLRPATVDPDTGYRGYSAPQLTQLNRIMALKELGLSLTQARRLLAGITVEELRGMLSCGTLSWSTNSTSTRTSCSESRPGSASSRGRAPCPQMTSWPRRFPPWAWS